MKLETAILYFLAARYPASFDAETVRMRVNRSGAIDGEASAEDVRKALALLAKRFGYVELVVGSERTEYLGESVTFKTYLGNLAVNAIEDRQAAIPPDKAVKDDFRLVRRFKGGFDNMLDNAGHHGDVFDGWKNSVHGLIIPVAECDAEAVAVGSPSAAALPGRENRMTDTPPPDDGPDADVGLLA